ncbi:hypothetical protein SOVF_209770 [Spinacia oleracea]|nr:hypothetical protein SOVF_209770 [Spinacia oleracea]
MRCISNHFIVIFQKKPQPTLTIESLCSPTVPMPILFTDAHSTPFSSGFSACFNFLFCAPMNYRKLCMQYKQKQHNKAQHIVANLTNTSAGIRMI